MQVDGQKTTEKILRLMRENPHITNKELAEACAITEDGVYWNTKKLREDLFSDLTNTSHFELPTAVLYGWLHSLMPKGILPCGALVEVE